MHSVEQSTETVNSLFTYMATVDVQVDFMVIFFLPFFFKLNKEFEFEGKLDCRYHGCFCVTMSIYITE